MKRALPFLVVLALAGCGTTDPPIGGKVPEKVYARVISLSPSVTELIALLNATNTLVGRTAGDNRPGFIKHVTIVANPLPDLEKIVKLQPDLILVEENLINPNELAKLREVGAFDVEVLNIDSIEDWEAAVWKIGSLLQAHTRASEVIDRVHQAIANAKMPNGVTKPKVLVAMSPQPPWVAGTKSYQSDVVRAAGGEPVGPDAERFVAVNPENILQWAPEIIFASESPAAFRGAGWDSTRAAKDGEILQIHPDILLRTGADLEKLITAMATEIRRVGSTR
jgi:ABC-type Fe3+-hydroxamate transport system substrate-binding protein